MSRMWRATVRPCLLTCRPFGYRRRRRQIFAALLQRDSPRFVPSGESDLSNDDKKAEGLKGVGSHFGFQRSAGCFSPSCWQMMSCVPVSSFLVKMAPTDPWWQRWVITTRRTAAAEHHYDTVSVTLTVFGIWSTYCGLTMARRSSSRILVK